MSFLTEITIRRVATITRTAAFSVPRASFSSSVRLQKTVTESAKDTLKSADRAVSDKLVDGINLAAAVGNKVKEAGADIAEGKETGKAAELRGEAKGTAAQAKGEAKGTASEVAGKVKGKAEEIKKKL